MGEGGLGQSQMADALHADVTELMIMMMVTEVVRGAGSSCLLPDQRSSSM